MDQQEYVVIGGGANLSKEFYEVVDIGGTHGLGRVSLVLQVIFTSVWSVHT